MDPRAMQEQPRHRHARAAAAMLLSWLVALPAGGAVYDVGLGGPGAGCEASTMTGALLTALLNPGPDEIHVARNQPYLAQYINLTDWTAGNGLTIAGGYDDCNDTTPSGRTVISGRATDPTFLIDGSGADCGVTLRDLEIVGSGVRGVRAQGGGASVTLANVDIWGNTGGVEVSGGAELSLDYASRVAGNSGAEQGGGIRCSGSGQVTLDAYIFQNSAEAGGGIYASGASCLVQLQGHAWVVWNEAGLGGGIFASGGASVSGSGGSDPGLRILENAADLGGGIYAAEPDTSVELVNALVEGNYAEFDGGGIYSGSEASVLLRRSNSPGYGCVDALRCSVLSGNRTGVGGSSAAYVDDGTVLISQTFVEANIAPAAATGGLFDVWGSNGALLLEGNQIWGNEAATLFAVSGDAFFGARFLTVARNFYDTTPAPLDSQVLSVSSNAFAILEASVLWDTAGSTTATGGTIDAHCVLADDVTGLTLDGTVLTTTDPQFADASVGNLHLRTTSPAVDFCDFSEFPPTFYDIDDEVRGFDLALNDNGSPGMEGGIYDLGADEVRPLFADGFELGNTDAWSSAAP